MTTEDSHQKAELSAVRVDDLSLTYPAKRKQPQRTALDGVSLCIPHGQSVALLGPNGSGKSTLMKIMCGLLTADSGTVTINGRSQVAARRAALGVVFQNDSLDRQMTIRENLRDQASLYGLYGIEARRRIDESLDAAGIADRADDLVKTLSAGLGRRADLCRALLHQPPVLLLDEPTVGLDPAARETFLAHIEMQRDQHEMTVLMSTHLMDEADRQDRVVLMHEGRIMADDSPTALRSGLGAMLVTVHDGNWHPTADSAHQWQRASGRWTLSLSDDGQRVRDLAAGLAGTGVAFSIAPPTLADAFEHFTGTKLTSQPSRLLPRRGAQR